MDGYGPEAFGELKADGYDAGLGDAMDRETADSVAFLAELAGGGRVLELAIGTGRVALPLAATGLSVHGIEASDQMVAKMRAKPGGDAIPVTIGDMAHAQADGTFDLIYLVFNTIFNLTTQEAQLACVRNAASQLTPEGVFVIETVVPDLALFRQGQVVRGRSAKKDAACFDVHVHDRAAQTVAYQRITISESGAKLMPHFYRYVWPSELDLMAQLAGLELRERWAWWDRSPFDAESKSHISIYGGASA